VPEYLSKSERYLPLGMEIQQIVKFIKLPEAEIVKLKKKLETGK
jgi:hypothetical protein